MNGISRDGSLDSRQCQPLPTLAILIDHPPWDARALNGGYFYDDTGSIIKNVVVNGAVDWKQCACLVEMVRFF
jgi:hypothetical protein